MSTVKFVLFVLLCFKLTSTFAQQKILFVTSNQHYYGDTNIKTSNHFGEIVVPYDIFTKAGFMIDFVSPEGGAIPIGYINTSDSIQEKYLYDGFFMNKLKNTVTPNEIRTEDYVAIFYSGGGAAMYGVAENKTLQNIAQEIYTNNGIISTICHGSAGIAYLKDKNGKSLYAGRKITGYPDSFEKKEKEYYKTFPFAIDEAIKNNEGVFIYSDKGNDEFYSVDERFVTGQDPSSATKIAEEVIKLINQNFKNKNRIVQKSELEQIRATLIDYIEGTGNGEPERLRRAFHPDFNLYTVAEDTLWIRSGEKYISAIKEGKKTSRIGRIISVDVEKDAAIAKAEIVIPNWRIFTDYFLLLKYEGTWKIVHKSYSWQEIVEKEN
ncbi:nuclear transport factor 2 family protein [Bernardetia sp. MNP-M8]|uniref:nuclear transport factor 2 family protein n=1 Tax=Bernardetia sp. MNP-M8 TaxID=3127470 RepID=UPI0030CF8AED